MMETTVRTRPATAAGVLVLTALCFALMTLSAVRNAAYRSQPGIWAEAARRAPGKQRPLHNLGCALAREGRYEEALAAFDAALAIGPDGSILLHFLHIERGNAFYHLGRYDDALAAWRRALETAPGDPEVLTNMAVVLLKQGRIDEADGRATAALAAKRPLPETYEVLGEISLARGEHRQAAGLLSRAVRMNAGLVDAYLNAGLAYEQSGEPAEARAMFLKYLEKATDEEGRKKARAALGRLPERSEKGRTGSRSKAILP